MSLITIDSVSGIPPYQIYVCDIFQFNCQFIGTFTDYIPPSVSFPVPSGYTTAPQLLIKIVDSTGCVFTQNYMCLTPTPTPSITPTNTPTLSLTPSNTPTLSVTPSFTPTPSITPSITPTNTVTPSITPTKTVTPTVTTTPTPTQTPEPFLYAYLFIEPYSGSSSIGSYMSSLGSSFYGFTNTSQPSTSASTFDLDMNRYVNYSGWTSGSFPSIIKQTVPITTSGLDSYGNPIIAYNFLTTKVPENTVGSKAWYTWIIPVVYTNYKYQIEIDLGIVNPNVFTSVKMEPTIYSNTFNYTGGTIVKAEYKVYTTYPSNTFELDNTYDLYFRGSKVDI
jgi:hypothetical protein